MIQDTIGILQKQKEITINEKEVVEPSNNDNSQEEQVLKDSITLKDTYQEGNNIIQEYEIILNNKKNNLQITYTYKYEIDSLTHVINGIMKNTNLYDMYLRDNINNKNYTKEELFNITKLNDEFNETNFKIIKGTDNKSYLSIFADNPYTAFLYIFNDQLNIVSDGIESTNWYDSDNGDGFVITSFVNIPVLENQENIWYEDTYNTNNNNIYVKVENNKIYYLTPNISYYEEYLNHVYDENYEVEVEERVYTINNNKLTYEVINTYQVLEVSNGIQLK